MTDPTGFGFRLLGQDGNARLGIIDTPRGAIRTPAFMPVGTAGTVKAVYFDQLQEIGTDIILGNTYHLMLRPGAERIARLGGLNRFIGWTGPILTDSGGFQVMSLAKLRRIDEQGVTFASHIDGSRHALTPERAMEIQHLLGSTIQMQLDECLAFPHSEAECARAMRLSLRWAERSLAAFRREPGHACFGILQGGIHPALRAESAERLAAMAFDGYAIGGLAVGETQEQMLATIDVTAPRLPEQRPRYLMGVGTPLDIVEAVARGIDMFDCVMPTRSGRHGQAFTRFGRLNLRNAKHADDPRPLDEASACPAASRYSRAYLHHLVKSGEILGMMLLSLANLAYYQELMAGLRQAIAEHRFLDHRQGLVAQWNRAEE
jgi:queuine tRNA-ribosyltransferase